MMRKRIIPVLVVTIIAIIVIILLNPSKKFEKMMIPEEEWESITNSRKENKNLTIDMIIFNDYVQIVDNKSNMIYYSTINNSVNKYNPSIKYKASKKANLVTLNDEISDYKIKESYYFKLLLYDDDSYHVYNLKCTDLPLLNIEYDLDSDDGSDSIPMKLTLFNNLEYSTNRVTISDGKFKRSNDNSYKFSLKMLTPGKHSRKNNRSILNMKPNSEYKLTPEDRVDNEFEDDSLKEKNDGNELDNKVELFINNEYQGKFLLINSEEKK